MSQVYFIPVACIVGLSVSIILSRATALPDVVAGGLAVAAAFAAMFAWMASPLPNGSTM